jgi:hypothetical protein
MCTGFVHKGNDVIVGYNLDLAINAFDYKVLKRKDYFGVSIKVGSTSYFTHGVRSDGSFANLPYMNGGLLGQYRRSKDCCRLDILVNQYLRGKITFKNILETYQKRLIVNAPHYSMHSLFLSPNDDIMILEPGIGYQLIKENYAIITNFPLLMTLPDYSNPWYGKDRYDKGLKILQSASQDFSMKEALKLLQETSQKGDYGTRLSFAYSKNLHSVYYCLEGDFTSVNVFHF